MPTMEYKSYVIEGELGYYDSKTSDDIKKNINEILQTCKANGCVLPSKDQLINYLRNYYDLCKHLFINSALLYAYDDKSETTCCEQLIAGPHDSKTDKCNIYSPYCAEALLVLYQSLEKIRDGANFENVHPAVKEMIASTYAIKAFRNFRHYSIRDMQPVLVSCENTDNFIAKKWYNLSSFELIKPIRLFGKIYRYISHRENKENNSEVLCQIIGAVYVCAKERPSTDGKTLKENDLLAYSPEMYDLCKWLNTNVKTNKRSIKFNIYINEQGMPKAFRSDISDISDSFCLFDGKIQVDFNYVKYSELSKKENISVLLKKMV